MSMILQLVGFRVKEEFFGAPIEKVKEIVKVPDVTEVPDTPAFFAGVINLRSRIIPVVEMRRCLGEMPEERTKANRVLVLDLDGSTVGLIVDSVSEIIKISEECVVSPSEIVSSVAAEYVAGVGKLKDRLIIMLDLEKLLNSQGIKKAAKNAESASADVDTQQDDAGTVDRGTGL